MNSAPYCPVVTKSPKGQIGEEVRNESYSVEAEHQFGGVINSHFHPPFRCLASMGGIHDEPTQSTFSHNVIEAINCC